MIQLLNCGTRSLNADYHTFDNLRCSMLGIVFTTTEEATHFIQAYTKERIDSVEEGSPIQIGDLLVAATGPGKIKATLTTERLLRDYEVTGLLATGTCVSLSDDLTPGTIVGANFVLEGDRVELDAPAYPRMPLDCPLEVSREGTLVTQDHTTEDDAEKSYWERIADVRDNTAYAVAYVAAQHGIPCHVAKVVSAERGTEPQDGASDEDARVLDTLSTFISDAVEHADEWAALK